MKTLFSILLLSIVSPIFAQEPSVNVKKEKLYINDNPVCIIDKKKKGFLSSPSFQVKTLNEKVLGIMQPMSASMPISGLKTWYKLTFEGIDDSIQLVIADFRNFNKASFLQYDEALGKIIASYELVKDSSVNKEGFDRLKKDYGVDYAGNYSEQFIKEKFCIAQIRGRAQSDSLKPVAVTLVNSFEATKFTTVINYDIMQDGKKIGTIIAKGNPKGAKKDDSEWDYSPGILDLDGASPLNYEVSNAEGCTLASYSGEEKYMATWRDGVQIKMADLKKYNKEGVKSRLSYIQAIANYLLVKRYL